MCNPLFFRIEAKVSLLCVVGFATNLYELVLHLWRKICTKRINEKRREIRNYLDNTKSKIEKNVLKMDSKQFLKMCLKDIF